MNHKIYDYIIVGSGLFGSIFARELTDSGANCLVIEKRNHIGGNCYTFNNNGINIHKYGPHIFHTSNEIVWNYINKFTKFNHYTNRTKVFYKGNLYSFPINLFTLYQLWNVITPEEAIKKLNQVKIKINNPSNLEEYALSEIGEELYKIFIYGYTKKQWGIEPNKLPPFILKRIPIRLNFDDNYYNDIHQGIPINGYTEIFHNLLKNIPIETNVDYLKDKDYFDKLANKIVYTGAIDEFFNYEEGQLEWRSLRFEEEIYSIFDYQGTSLINYTEEEIPYKRIVEHKHFYFGNQDFTIITKEYSDNWNIEKEKYYPVNNNENNLIYLKYKNKINNKKFIFGGRLADYKYYDMQDVIYNSLISSKKEI
jgi:UDP-galactopyranose mutase